MTNAAAESAHPWYRDRWPWLLISIPAISAVLGVAMLVLALQSDDGLVADDYYKQGLGINEVLDKKTHAGELGLSAQLSINDERSGVRVLIHGQSLPAAQLLLRFVHPTRAGEDQRVMLKPLGGSMYEGALVPLAAGRWHVMLEDGEATWRLSGVWQTSASQLALEASPDRKGK
jgi:hypothetical protein